MPKRKSRLILDTNLWISFLITKDYSKLDNILFEKKAKIVFSSELLEEFLDVVKRPRFRHFFSLRETEELLETVQDHSEFIEVVSDVKICRDEKDNFLLSLAKNSGADYLITGDKDLLIIESIDNTKILTLRDFIDNY